MQQLRRHAECVSPVRRSVSAEEKHSVGSRLGRSLFVVATVLTAATCRLDQLVVHPDAALLCVTPSEPDTLLDSAAVGSARWRRDTISIRNCGGGELRWTASVGQGTPWLAILPDSGV